MVLTKDRESDIETANPVISVIIPAYNEEAGIGKALNELCSNPYFDQSEIIVVDDGSVDRTSEEVARFPQVRLIRKRINHGYGAALSTGMKQARGKYVFWYDADGQHRVQDLISVIDTLVLKDLEYCIGVRDIRSYEINSRRLGKAILRSSVELAAGQPIGDFNSGLRGFKRELISHYLHLMPKGFGASTTTTLLMLERGHLGEEVPIVVRARIGTSTVKPFRDGTRTLMIVLRIFLLFKPLLFFGTIGAIFIIAGSIYGFYEALSLRQGFPVFAALIIILGVQALFFGLLNDQISHLRRERLD